MRRLHRVEVLVSVVVGLEFVDAGVELGWAIRRAASTMGCVVPAVWLRKLRHHLLHHLRHRMRHRRRHRMRHHLRLLRQRHVSLVAPFLVCREGRLRVASVRCERFSVILGSLLFFLHLEGEDVDGFLFGGGDSPASTAPQRTSQGSALTLSQVRLQAPFWGGRWVARVPSRVLTILHLRLLLPSP